MQNNGVRRRKVMQYESVSKTANAYRRSDHLGLSADSSLSPQSLDSGPAYRYEYEYERSSFEIFSPTPDSFAVNGKDVLAQVVGDDIAQQFLWLAETDTIRTYENRLTHRYVHLDTITGQFCDQQRNIISAQAALTYATPASQVLPARFPFSSSLADLQIGGFVRQSAVDARNSDLQPESSRPSDEPDSTPRHGVLSQIRRLLVMKFGSDPAFPEHQNAAARQRAGLSLHEDYRPGLHGRDEFSVAAFTRRTA